MNTRGHNSASCCSGKTPDVLSVGADSGDKPQKRKFRLAFADYMSFGASIIPDATVATIQGDHEYSLLMELQLTPRNYSAIIIDVGW